MAQTETKDRIQAGLEFLAAELGEAAGAIERETRLRLDTAISKLERSEAERELRFAKLERELERKIEAIGRKSDS